MHTSLEESQQDVNRRQAWFLLVQAYKTVVESTDRAIKKEGRVSLVEYELLSRLSHAPDHKLRMIDIATMLLVSRSGVSRLVRRVEKLGYVRLEDSPEDRRVTYTILTGKGVEAVRRTYEVFARASEESLAAHLGPDDLNNLCHLLRQVIDGSQPGEARWSDLQEMSAR